ncbi:hypothetical protein L1049_006110 [Liquidambar formosana]|uniref:Uncharacterized protein n=1 Tax=Liquidambar formosana TaxID=63359 RepID=A0AAP0RGP0_LIQFO
MLVRLIVQEAGFPVETEVQTRVGSEKSLTLVPKKDFMWFRKSLRLPLYRPAGVSQVDAAMKMPLIPYSLSWTLSCPLTVSHEKCDHKTASPIPR